MRIFQILCRSRKPQNPYKVPLAKPRLNFALRNRISTKKQKSTAMPAIQEMQNLITKLAQNEYNDQFCQKEIKEMIEANSAAYKVHIAEKEENRGNFIKPGPHLNPVPLNKYLGRNYPLTKPNPFEDRIQDHSELPFFKQKY